MPVVRRRIDRSRQNKSPLKQRLRAMRRDSCTNGNSSSASSSDDGGDAEEKKQERKDPSEEEDESYVQKDSSSSPSFSQTLGDESSSSEQAVRRRRASQAGSRTGAETSMARKKRNKKAKAQSCPRTRDLDKNKSKKPQARRHGMSGGDESDADGLQSDDEEGSKYSFQDDSNDEDYSVGQDGGSDDDDDGRENDSLELIDDKPLASPWGSVRKRRRPNKDSSNDSEFLADASSVSGASSRGSDEDEELAPSDSRRRRRRPSGDQRGRKSLAGKLKMDDQDDESYSASTSNEGDFGSPSRSRKRSGNEKPAAATGASIRYRSTWSSEDKNFGPSPKSSSRLVRKVPTSARRSHRAKENSESEDSYLNHVGSLRGIRRARLERLSESRRRHQRRVSIQEVRDEDVGDSEESSSLEDRKMRRVTQEGEVRSSDSDGGRDSSSTDEYMKRASIEMGSPRRRTIDCPSAFDAITEEDLPRMHVCFCTPDGAGRYCFALETLRQIALTSLDPKTDAEGKVTFLQPLHFRTAMSDDLIDQIASRFGRGALDILGPFYDRSSASADGIRFNPQSFAVYDKEGEFKKRVRKFGRSIMGSRDLYVCPLCYTVAYNRMMDSREGAGTRKKNTYDTDFQEDPMYILGDVDGDEFNVAAAFCFSSIRKVESHLRHDHHMTPRKTNRDLYARYAIRKQDGLVQRFVHSIADNVMRYWLDGYNFDFVYLVQQTDKANACRLIVNANEVEDAEDLAEAIDFLEKGKTYFASFQHDVKALWNAISAPYSTQDDVGNFVVEDGAEEEDPDAGRMAHLAFMRQGMEDEMEEDKKWVERLQRVAEGNREQEDDDAELQEESDVDYEAARHQYDSDISSEASEDEWMAKRRASMEARRAKGRAQAKAI